MCDFNCPNWIELQNVYLEDTHRDTLIAGGRIFVDLDVWGLLQNKVGINEVNLENIYLNVHRTLPDTTFNFTFIRRLLPAPILCLIRHRHPWKSDWIVKLKNVRLVYRDALIGTDANLWLIESNINFSAFNPSLNRYHLTSTDLNTGKGSVRMYAPLRPSQAGANSLEVAATSSDSLDFKIGKNSGKKLRFSLRRRNSEAENRRQNWQVGLGERLYLPQ